MNSSGSHLFKDAVLLCEITKYHQFMIRRVTTDLETVTVLQGELPSVVQGFISRILPSFVHISNPISFIPVT
jgi:hypothetical protein